MSLAIGATALAVLAEPDPAGKAELSERALKAWRSGALSDLSDLGISRPPSRPARPARPSLQAPRHMARRRGMGLDARRALLHAIAHIELNAIDLAWDLIARFGQPDFPPAFFADWIETAADEARHFLWLNQRLGELGAAYGDLPAHDGLWEAAEKTADCLRFRLAVVPMALEARGLDSTPATIARLEAGGDQASAQILGAIVEEEIAHVAAGRRWFEFFCARRGEDPVAAFRGFIARGFTAILKPPFAAEARARAGLGPDYYQTPNDTGSEP